MEQEHNLEQEQYQREMLEQMLTHIEDLMADEKYEEAQSVLHQALRLEVYDHRVYQRYAFILRMLDRVPAAELFEGVVMSPGDAEAYYKVAHALLKDKLYGAAIGPLTKVLELVPMATNVNFELGYSYMKEMDTDTALHYFEVAYELEPNPHTAFYVGYASMLMENVARTKELLPFIEGEYQKMNVEPIMLNILKEMIERYEAFPPKDVRDWHFVQYGTPLLRMSNEDLEEPVADLNGRYVFINYGWWNLAVVLKTFKRLMEEVPGFPKFDYLIPASFKSTPIGFALSEMLELPLVGPDAMKSDGKGLLICSWTDEIEQVSSHIIGNPNVTLFSFSLGFTMQATICPEVVGYLDQANRLPWEATVEILENGECRERPAMTLLPEVVAQYIIDRLDSVSDEEIEPVVAYYKERAHLLKVGEKQNSPRLSFQTESPIQSMRMMV